MESFYDFEDIEAYVHGQMSEGDRKAFEAALATDTVLAQKVEAMRLEAPVLQLLREDALWKQFEQWESEIDAEKPELAPNLSNVGPAAKKAPFYRTWVPITLTIVAALVLLFLAWQFKWVPFGQQTIAPAHKDAVADSLKNKIPIATKEETQPPVGPNTQVPQTETSARVNFIAMAREYYDANNVTSTIRNIKKDAGSDTLRYTQAARYYEKQQYREALALLQQPDSAQLQKCVFLRAHTAYHLDSLDISLKDFRSLQRFSFAPYKFSAQWGEVVCLVARMPTTQSELKPLLEAIGKNKNHPYQKRAKALLQEKGIKGN